MYTKDQLNDLYERIVKDIDISDALFDAAEREYTELGEWIDRETPTYKVSIYPQGSFALGTVNKPITGADDYDLDLVCEFDILGNALFPTNRLSIFPFYTQNLDKKKNLTKS